MKSSYKLCLKVDYEGGTTWKPVFVKAEDMRKAILIGEQVMYDMVVDDPRIKSIEIWKIEKEEKKNEGLMDCWQHDVDYRRPVVLRNDNRIYPCRHR